MVAHMDFYDIPNGANMFLCHRGCVEITQRMLE